METLKPPLLQFRNNDWKATVVMKEPQKQNRSADCGLI